MAEEAPRVSTLRADVPAKLDEFIAPAAQPRSGAAAGIGGERGADPVDVGRRRPGLRESPSCAECVTRKSRGRQMLPKKVRPPRAARIAQRSLSELLRTGLVAIPEERPRPVTPQLEPKPPRRGTGRKIAAWVAAAALVGAVVFGVTILLKTPEGTLKIDSDVSNVSVELVNEENQSKPLQTSAASTKRRCARRYRVRFAGTRRDRHRTRSHHAERREQTVARITRIPSSVKVPGAETAKTAPELKSEDPFAAGTQGPLYQGLSEQEWQQMFAVETSPTAKLDEAVALVTLAAELAPKERIEKLLSVGAEIVHASYGDDVIDFALADPTKPPTAAPRWQINKSGERYISLPDARFNRRGGRVAVPRDSDNREDVYSAYSRFQDLVNHEFSQYPRAQPLAEALSQAMRQKGPARGAAFAASLLRVPARLTIQQNPEAAQIVLAQR